MERSLKRNLQAFGRKLMDPGYETAELIATARCLFAAETESRLPALNGFAFLTERK